MQRCYRMLPAFVFSIILGVYLLSPLKAASPTLNEDGVPAAVQERLAALGQNPIKAMNPQDKEISLFYAGSALWQGMNVACGDGNYMYGYPFLGLQIIGVSNPFSPEVIAEYHHPAAAEDMVIDGNYLYVAAGYEGGLLIFDVSDPHEPILTGSLMTVDNMPLEPYGIEIIGATAYLSCGLKFVIADISDPSSPQVLHVVDPVGVAYDAIIMDSYAYIASEVFVELWDISGDPAPIYVEMRQRCLQHCCVGRNSLRGQPR